MPGLTQNLIGLLVGTTACCSALAYDLDQHAWRDRLLILAAPSVEDPQLAKQLRSARERQAALEDRRLRVFVLMDKTGAVDGIPLSSDDVAFLRRAFEIEPHQTAMLLVGLDGAVKRRDGLDTELRELFLEIDAMPMRRAEIRARRAAGESVTEP